MASQVWGRNIIKGAMDISPESETNFFDRFYGVQLNFVKNDKGEVTAVTYHQPGMPDCQGRKVSGAGE